MRTSFYCRFRKCPPCSDRAKYGIRLFKTNGIMSKERTMKKTFLILEAAVVLSSCATMPKESPILELDNIALDGEQWIKVQNIDKNTGKPIANAECAVYLLKEDGIGRIVTKTDKHGWVYIQNVPDGKYYIMFSGE